MLQVRQSPGSGLECDTPERYTFEGVVPTAELNSIPEASRMVVILNTTPLVKGQFAPKGPLDGGGKTQQGLFYLDSPASMD